MNEELKDDLTDIAALAEIPVLDLGPLVRRARRRQYRAQLPLVAAVAVVAAAIAWFVPTVHPSHAVLGPGPEAHASAVHGTGPSATASARPESVVGSGNFRGADPHPAVPAPCPTNSVTPSIATGRFCGPAPTEGNGLGAHGTCTGREKTLPCAAGVKVGQLFSYTFTGSCTMIFDGRIWYSELPGPAGIYAAMWIQLTSDGGAAVFGPTGSVGLTSTGNQYCPAP